MSRGRYRQYPQPNKNIPPEINQEEQSIKIVKKISNSGTKVCNKVGNEIKHQTHSQIAPLAINGKYLN